MVSHPCSRHAVPVCAALPVSLRPSCINNVYDVEVICQQSGGAVAVRKYYECQLLEFPSVILGPPDEVDNHRLPFYRVYTGDLW